MLSLLGFLAALIFGAAPAGVGSGPILSVPNPPTAGPNGVGSGPILSP